MRCDYGACGPSHCAFLRQHSELELPCTSHPPPVPPPVAVASRLEYGDL
jgi:hypothetical protein